MSNEVRLDDGHATIVTLSEAPTIKLYEKEVTPPGMSAGGPIDTTTMRNVGWRTFSPRQLMTLTPTTATVAYATEAIPVLYDLVGVLQQITVTFPDGSSVEFWGWIESFTPGSNVEGEQPTASITFQPSNTNADGEEVAPAYSEPAASS
jgi:hypothetical protein